VRLEVAFEIVSRPVLAKVRPRPTDTSRGFTAHELYAEAVLLISWCEQRFTPSQMAYARCRFGSDEGAVPVLARHLMAEWGIGERRHQGIEELVMSYCIRARGMREVRAAMRSSLTLAMAYRDLVYDELDRIHDVVTKVLAERELRSKLLVA
jgi:hypothetical protein